MSDGYDIDGLFNVAPDGAELLDELHTWLRAYVAFPSQAASAAVTLWCAHAHLAAEFESTPRLALLSPEKQCGKTRVLELAELVCPGSERLSDASPAYMFRRIGAGDVTVMLDEADTIWKRGKADEAAEALRGIVNTGHRKGGFVGRVRMNGENAELERHHVYAPVALAGIGNCLPDTILDRSIIVAMRRRAPGETVRSYRERITRPEGDALREKLALWATGVAGKVGDPWPNMPEGVADRPADVWEPLVMTADLAGGQWSALAREACREFVAGISDDTASVGVRLLSDLRDIFGDLEAMSTEVLLAKLHGIEEAPWDDWYGRRFTARDLSKMLKPYGVKPKVIRVGDATPRGYRRADLHDAWSRYLPPGSATGATSATSLVRTVADVADVADTRGDGGPVAADAWSRYLPQGSATGATSATPLTCTVTDVADVADTRGDGGPVADAADFTGGDSRPTDTPRGTARCTRCGRLGGLVTVDAERLCPNCRAGPEDIAS